MNSNFLQVVRRCKHCGLEEPKPSIGHNPNGSISYIQAENFCGKAPHGKCVYEEMSNNFLQVARKCTKCGIVEPQSGVTFTSPCNPCDFQLPQEMIFNSNTFLFSNEVRERLIRIETMLAKFLGQEESKKPFTKITQKEVSVWFMFDNCTFARVNSLTSEELFTEVSELFTRDSLGLLVARLLWYEDGHERTEESPDLKILNKPSDEVLRDWCERVEQLHKLYKLEQ